jgi:hypothetical protein
MVARTSAFEFKGQNRNIRMIGEQLGASHLIEGSVRKAGDRVRITVHLISAADGTRIWSENYDRELTDIFAIQEEIARAVASSLSVPLGLRPGENLVSNRSVDADTYQQYLRAKALVSCGPGECRKRSKFSSRWSRAIPIMRPLGPYSHGPTRRRRSTAATRWTLCAVPPQSFFPRRKRPPGVLSNWIPISQTVICRWPN